MNKKIAGILPNICKKKKLKSKIPVFIKGKRNPIRVLVEIQNKNTPRSLEYPQCNLWIDINNHKSTKTGEKIILNSDQNNLYKKSDK